MPLPPPPRQRAAHFMGVDLHGALNFARGDVRRVLGDLSRNAPDSRLIRDTNRLIDNWVSRGGQAMQALQHGFFQKAEDYIQNIGTSLSWSGVTSPEVHQALNDVNTVLRHFDCLFSHGPGIPGMPGWP